MMTAKRSVLATLTVLELARSPRVAAASGAGHHEAATQPLSFELVRIEITATSKASALRCSNRAATRVNILKVRAKCSWKKIAICRYFAIPRNVQQPIKPPLHGGGQGFESPRLHSENVVICRINEAETGRSVFTRSLYYTSPIRKSNDDDKPNKAL